MRRLLPSLLLVAFILSVSSQTCTSTTLASQYLASSVGKVTTKICPIISSSSCCTSQYFTDLSSNWTTTLNSITSQFNAISKVYDTKLNSLLNYSKHYNITYFFEQALNWTYTDPTSDFLNLDYLTTLPNVFTEYQSVFQNMISSFQTCAQTVLTHYGGLSCQMCNQSFPTAGYFSGPNGSQINIDFTTCSRIQKDCYPYMTSRAYLSNLINVYEVMTAFFNTTVYLEAYLNNETNPQTRLSFANSLRNVTVDYFEFPDHCSSQFNCYWSCMYFVNSAGVNLTALLNPTSRLNYSVNSFRRVLQQIDESIKRNKYSELIEKADEAFEASRNLQYNLTPTITVTNPNGIYFTTIGITTIPDGAQNNTGLNPTLNLAQYSFAGGARLCAALMLAISTFLTVLLA